MISAGKRNGGSARSQSRGMSSSLLAEQNGKDLQIGQKSHLSTLQVRLGVKVKAEDLFWFPGCSLLGFLGTAGPVLSIRSDISWVI